MSHFVLHCTVQYVIWLQRKSIVPLQKGSICLTQISVIRSNCVTERRADPFTEGAAILFWRRSALSKESHGRVDWRPAAMQKLNQMSCVSPVQGKCMVVARKACLPLDLSLTALLSAREQNVIRNTFLSEGLTSAESPGISEHVQLCMCLPISARQSRASFHFRALSPHMVLSSISFHLKSVCCTWDTAVELRCFRRWRFYRARKFQRAWENRRVQSEPFPTPAFHLGTSVQTAIPCTWPLLVCQKSNLSIGSTQMYTYPYSND